VARGSVKKRGTAYSIVYDGPAGPDGQRRQRRESGFRTKREAQERLTAALREVDTGTSLEPSTLTVADYLRHWLATMIAPHKRPLTVYRYTAVAHNHVAPHLGALLLAKLTPAQVARWHATLGASGLAPTSVASSHAVLSTALRQAVRWQLIARNPCDLAPFAKPEHVAGPVWDTATAQRFQLAVADDPDAVLWLLAIAAASSGAGGGSSRRPDSRPSARTICGTPTRPCCSSRGCIRRWCRSGWGTPGSARPTTATATSRPRSGARRR
jgi:hypothetical protein